MSTHSEKKNADFGDMVESIRSAESDSDRIKAEYEGKISALAAAGREKAVEMKEAYEKKAEDAKAELLSSEREKIESAAQEVISKAGKQAVLLRAKRLEQAGINAVFANFVSLL